MCVVVLFQSPLPPHSSPLLVPNRLVCVFVCRAGVGASVHRKNYVYWFIFWLFHDWDSPLGNYISIIFQACKVLLTYHMYSMFPPWACSTRRTPSLRTGLSPSYFWSEISPAWKSKPLECVLPWQLTLNTLPSCVIHVKPLIHVNNRIRSTSSAFTWWMRFGFGLSCSLGWEKLVLLHRWWLLAI